MSIKFFQHLIEYFLVPSNNDNASDAHLQISLNIDYLDKSREERTYRRWLDDGWTQLSVNRCHVDERKWSWAGIGKNFIQLQWIEIFFKQ